jgi:dTDP-4-amino-4,6-dideoxygalactose transaminase
MNRVDEILEARKRIAARYDDALRSRDWLRIPIVPEGYVHGYQAYVCLFAPDVPTRHNLAALNQQRNELMGAMEQRGIATRQGTHAPVLLDYYRTKYSIRDECFPNAVASDRLSVALPLYPQMSDAEQDRVVAELDSCFGLNNKSHN